MAGALKVRIVKARSCDETTNAELDCPRAQNTATTQYQVIGNYGYESFHLLSIW
jgi:hypothetical protein